MTNEHMDKVRENQPTSTYISLPNERMPNFEHTWYMCIWYIYNIYHINKLLNWSSVSGFWFYIACARLQARWTFSIEIYINIDRIYIYI